jgi:hypothetical protein
MRFLFILSLLVSSSLAYLMTPKDRVQTTRNGPEGCLSYQPLLQAPESGYSLPAYDRSSNFPSPNVYSSTSAPASAANTATPTPSPTAKPTSTGSYSSSSSAFACPPSPAQHTQGTPEPSLSHTLIVSPSNNKLLLPSDTHQTASESVTGPKSTGGLRGSRWA